MLIKRYINIRINILQHLRILIIICIVEVVHDIDTRYGNSDGVLINERTSHRCLELYCKVMLSYRFQTK
jgi:hypothetical protein